MSSLYVLGVRIGRQEDNFPEFSPVTFVRVIGINWVGRLFDKCLYPLSISPAPELVKTKLSKILWV